MKHNIRRVTITMNNGTVMKYSSDDLLDDLIEHWDANLRYISVIVNNTVIHTKFISTVEVVDLNEED